MASSDQDRVVIPGQEQPASAHRAESGALRACPFCGSANVDPEGWAATGADGKGPIRTGPACDDCGGSADSVDLWNCRPGETELLGALLLLRSNPIGNEAQKAMHAAIAKAVQP